MEATTDAANLRVLILMAEADGSIAPQEQKMLESIWKEHVVGAARTPGETLSPAA